MIVKKTAFEAQWEEVGRCVLTLMDDEGSKWKDVFVETELHFELLEITWESGIKAARNKKTITGPHWEKAHWLLTLAACVAPAVGALVDDDIIEEDKHKEQHYSSGSKKPGVYLFDGKGKNLLKVKIKVHNKNGLSGKIWLHGKLKTLNMKSVATIPLMEGEHEVPVEITNLPSTLQHYEGDSEWGYVFENDDARLCEPGYIAERPRLEVFVVYNDPTIFTFYKDGVWVEALRLMLRKVGGAGITGSKPDDISGKITEYCHTLHGMKYDTRDGAACFVSRHDGGVFDFMGYIQKHSASIEKNNLQIDKEADKKISLLAVKLKTEVEKIKKDAEKEKKAPNTVNCYDQAAAVQAFCGCLGIATNWLFVQPFGYIKSKKLVGINERCNNPFFDNPNNIGTPFANALRINVGSKEMTRSGFLNHAFIKIYDDSYVRDACAGPYIESKIIEQYLKNTIDNDKNISVEYYNNIIDTASYIRNSEKKAYYVLAYGPSSRYKWANFILSNMNFANSFIGIQNITDEKDMFLAQQTDGKALIITTGLEIVS
jgi:hypothetical protein